MYVGELPMDVATHAVSGSLYVVNENEFYIQLFNYMRGECTGTIINIIIVEFTYTIITPTHPVARWQYSNFTRRLQTNMQNYKFAKYNSEKMQDGMSLLGHCTYNITGVLKFF